MDSIDAKDIEYAKIANYFSDNKSSVRKTARFFGISKTKVHNALTSERLRLLNKDLFNLCRKILNSNKKNYK